MLSNKSLFQSIVLVVGAGIIAAPFSTQIAAQSQSNQYAVPTMSRSEQIESFKLSNKMWYSNLALAFNASTCGLRSTGWWEVFQSWNIRRAQMNSNRLKLTPIEEKEMEREAEVIWRSIVAQHTCETIAGRLGDLDDMHQRITLGYR